MKTFRLTTDNFREHLEEISCGDEVLLSGTVYTARDAAHKKIVSLINAGEKTPFELDGAFVYYAGPTPEREGCVCGSFGPTTSSRMDPYSPLLLDKGLFCMIGKGPRSNEVIEAIKRNKAIYLCAIGGAGALASKCITSLDVIAFPELGCESVKKLTFKDFPLICGIDTFGRSLFN
ncbi:MAG: fumarate hydratase C-terminal domain-containing protein [Clostridia bacterium]|nr:fumarate hydratase C-terminal domain-containing protein [Clostridia bacterium]